MSNNSQLGSSATRLLLVRHGQTAWNAEKRLLGLSDVSLNDVGRSQSYSLAQYLRRMAQVDNALRPAALYSSPLPRAWQTAVEIGMALDLPVQADERIKDYDAGQVTGLTPAEIRERFPEWLAEFYGKGQDVTPPGGETNWVFTSRVIRAMDELIARHPGQTIMVVSHSEVLGVMLQHLLKVQTITRTPFEFDNGSLSTVEVGPPDVRQRVRVVRLNYVPGAIGLVGRQ